MLSLVTVDTVHAAHLTLLTTGSVSSRVTRSGLALPRVGGLGLRVAGTEAHLHY